MWTFKTGDLVAFSPPSHEKPLKVGIVIAHDETTFNIKWTSYDKDFFMEKEGDIFQELNNSYILNIVQINRNNRKPFLVLLNSNYSDERLR
tara:strand:- start:10490 stop:10762 length:273 start_codon:yes stop_codon:yes gene_type:complete